MFIHRKIRIGKRSLEVFQVDLTKKRLIMIKGRMGYIMCGYLDLRAAERFDDAAVKITGVSTIKDMLKGTVHSRTKAAGRLGIKKGQSVRDILKFIA